MAKSKAARSESKKDAAPVWSSLGSLRWALKPRGISKSKTNLMTTIKTEDNELSGTKNETPLEQPSNHFRFLDLPAELREHIYKSVSESEPAYLSKNFCGYMITRNALARVSRDIRDEFISAAYVYTTEIRAFVLDLDFRHIVTFLNRLSEREMRELLEGPSSRQLRIDITFTKSWSDYYSPSTPLLSRWLNRMLHPTKKGTKLVTSYNVVAHDTHHSRAWISQAIKSKSKCFGRNAKKAEELRKFDAELDKVIAAVIMGPGR